MGARELHRWIAGNVAASALGRRLARLDRDGTLAPIVLNPSPAIAPSNATARRALEVAGLEKERNISGWGKDQLHRRRRVLRWFPTVMRSINATAVGQGPGVRAAR